MGKHILINNNDSGFTLVEILVSISLIAIISTITSQIFILGLRSHSKSETVKEIKQNGDYAMSIMENTIRNAIDINQQCNTNDTYLSVTNPDGGITTFDCSGENIASISGEIPKPPEPTPTGIALTNDRVHVISCNFRIVCPTPPLYPKYVFINFNLNRSGSSLTPTPGDISVLEYQNTVSLRNL